MVVHRCRYCLCRIMSRCSLTRLVVAVTVFSVMATITFFLYSRTLDTHGNEIKQMKLRARSKHLTQKGFEERLKYIKEESEEHPLKPRPREIIRLKSDQHPQGSDGEYGPNDSKSWGRIADVVKPEMKDSKAKKQIVNSRQAESKASGRGADSRRSKFKEAKADEKMAWPDRKKGEKGRKVPKVRESKNRNKAPNMFEGVTDPIAVPRIAEYCNLPVKEQRGKEGEAPPGYALKSVYAIIRHGDRSPMASFKNSPNPDISCQFSEPTKLDIPNSNKFRATLDYFKNHLHPGNSFPFPLYPKSPSCDLMQLTGQGAQQHLLNGLHFYHRYVQKWRLFSDPFTPDQVYIKSTGYTRTYQSAIALLYTFLPKFNLTELNIFKSDNLLFCSQKSFGRPCICPNLQMLKKLSDKEVAAFDKNNTQLKQVRQHVAKVLNIDRQDLPWLWSIIDTLMIYACHNIKLPCNKNNDCIDPSTLAELWRQLDIHGANLERVTPYQKYVRLGIHPLLHEIKQHMLLTTKNRAKVKFALYSGHDNTVSPLATVLGIGNGRWPKYATRIVFELYARDDPKKHHFLRILMNGEDVTSKVSFCKGLAKNGFCKLKYFVDFIQKDNMSIFDGQTYSQACGIKRA